MSKNNITNKEIIKNKKHFIYSKKVFFDAIFAQIILFIFFICIYLFLDSFSFGNNILKIFNGTVLEKKEDGIISSFLTDTQQEDNKQFTFVSPLKVFEEEKTEDNIFNLKTECGAVIYSPVNGVITEKNFYLDLPYMKINSFDYDVYIIGYQGCFYKIGDTLSIGDKVAFCVTNELKIMVKKQGENIDIIGENLWIL